MTTPVATTFYSHRISRNYLPEDYREYLMNVVDDPGLGEQTGSGPFSIRARVVRLGHHPRLPGQDGPLSLQSRAQAAGR